MKQDEPLRSEESLTFVFYVFRRLCQKTVRFIFRNDLDGDLTNNNETFKLLTLDDCVRKRFGKISKIRALANAVDNIYLFCFECIYAPLDLLNLADLRESRGSGSKVPCRSQALSLFFAD